MKSKLKLQMRSGLTLFLVAAAFLMVLPSAFGQDFSLSMSQFSPFAVAPGQDSASNIMITKINGSNPVNLTCVITTQTENPTLPTCTVSPSSLTPSGTATATITSDSSTTAALYTVTVTATSSTTTVSQSQNLTVLSVAPQFTITVQTAIAPTSVPAGSGGQGVISINPINSYNSGSGGVTLSCASISPLVTLPPVCSFNPQPVIVNGTPTTSTITITSAGPIITGAATRSRMFYGLWLPLPMLALVGLGAAVGGKRSRKAWGLLALFVISGSLLLMPACANGGTTTTTPNGITPANSYTFTILGVDTKGNISSNTNTTGTNASVSLTVTAPTN